MEDKIFSSLTADNELKSILELLDKGELKQCKREIDKNLKKLKREGDILNFKIVKMLLMHKMKNFEETKTLKTEIKNGITTIKNEDIANFFKRSLRDIGDDTTISEIFKNSLKNKNFVEISKDEQNEIIKELTVLSEFNEIYRILNILIDKNIHKDKNFLLLLKYEIVYILCVKLKKLPNMILNKTLKDLSSDTNLVSQKGYIDLMIKYNLIINDFTNLQSFLEKNVDQFANAPIKDLLCEMYFKKNELIKCINFILKEIINNIDKCYYSYYERLVCLTVLLLERSNFEFSSINVNDLTEATNKEKVLEYNNFMFSDSKDSESLYNLITILNTIKNNFLVDNFNSHKSASISLLLLFNLLILKGKNLNIITPFIFHLLKNLLVNAKSKQSILFEISKYFIYLDDESKQKIFFELSCDNKTNEDQIFLIKLEKLFGMFTNSYTDSAESNIKLLTEKISSLFNIYYKMTVDVVKIEKGERIVGDDIIVIINEYLFEIMDNLCVDNKNHESDEFQKLLLMTLNINYYAHNKSIYNYDITIFLIKLSATLNLNSLAFDKLKYMNLKGPQFETVSYFCFKYFYLDSNSQGNDFLVKSFNKWQKENRRSVKQTLWKMFQSFNLWNSDELIDFESEENKSYYKHIINYQEILINFCSKLDKIDSEEMLSQILKIRDLFIESFTLLETNLKFLKKNQDLFVNYPKYKEFKFFKGDYNFLAISNNYSEQKYKFSLDSANKNNLMFESHPNQYNNFFEQNEVEVFGCFNNLEFLRNRYLTNILCYSANDKENFIKYYKLYSTNFSLVYSDKGYEKIHISSKENFKLFSKLDFLLNGLICCIYELDEDANSLSKHVDNLRLLSNSFENELNLMSELRVKLLSEYNLISLNCFLSKFHILIYFFTENITILLSALINKINSNSKVPKNICFEVKSFLSTKIKAQLLNLISENIEKLDKFNGLDKMINSFSSLKGCENDRENLKIIIYDETTKIIKDLKDSSRKKRDFIKNII